MPPSSDSDHRRQLASASVGLHGGGGSARGGEGASNNVSREWQAGQDERRTKEWRQVRVFTSASACMMVIASPWFG